MDQEDLKAIGGLLDKKLDEKFDEKLAPIKKDLGELKESVEANTGSVMKLESEIKSYKDSLDVERKRFDKHDGRLEVIEDSLGLEKV